MISSLAFKRALATQASRSGFIELPSAAVYFEHDPSSLRWPRAVRADSIRKKPVVLLHDATGSMEGLRKTRKALIARNFAVLLYDRAGFGRTNVRGWRVE